jgi:ADP-ribose pyrophosphatase YjhB (NUDIX family)
MATMLTDFLSPLTPYCVQRTTWGTMRLTCSSFLHDVLPPAQFITSVRAVVCSASGYAVLHNRNGSHLLPGGRLDGDESLDTALRREVLEETGCVVESAHLLGFMWFHHETPKPEAYAYPYPDFVQVVYAAHGRRVIQEPVDPTGWEERVEFVSRETLQQRSFSRGELLFLEASSAAFGDGG